MNRSSASALELIEELGKTSNTLQERVFVSPVYRNRWVATRIDKIIYRFKIRNAQPGWYRFQPISQNAAKRIGEAEFSEIEGYLKILDTLRLVMVRREGDVIFGVPFKGNKYGFEPTQIFPVYLAQDDMAMDFDEILCRFDGANVWYETVPMNNDPARSEYLRTALNERTVPGEIEFTGLRFEDKIAYAVRHQLMLDEEEAIRKAEREARKAAQEAHDRELMRNSRVRIQRAVEHGGGVFKSFTERGNNFTVTYTVDGDEYTSQIAKDRNLTVLTAGFCLSGRDRDFDLTSLISVIREGEARGLIYRW